MASVSFQVTGLDQLQRMQAFLAPETFLKAQRGGISYALKAVSPAVAKGIGAAYSLKAARIKQDILSAKIDPGGLSATVRFSRRPPTLAAFNPKPGKRGHQPGLGRGMGWGKARPQGKPLTALVVKAQGRRAYPGAFLATGASGNQLVLRRGPAGQLLAMHGPSIGSIFLGRSSIGPQLRMDVEARINEQFIKGFQRVLDSAARGF
jgi:hypothetical protein